MFYRLDKSSEKPQMRVEGGGGGLAATSLVRPRVKGSYLFSQNVKL